MAHGVGTRSGGLLAMGLAALLLPACVGPAVGVSPEGPARPRGASASAGAGEGGARSGAPGLAVTSLRAGLSWEGREITCHVLGQGPQTVLLLGTIHGDEDAGTPLLEALVEHLRHCPEDLAGRRVVVIPVANPDGFARRRRTNDRGVDLNRNFPASNRRDGRRYGQVLSEPESRALHELVERYRPVVAVSVHGWASQVDWDGPAAGLARAMAAGCDLPARQLGANPGSLGSFLGVDRQVPTITLEMPGAARSMEREALWERFGSSLLTAIAWPGS